MYYFKLKIMIQEFKTAIQYAMFKNQLSKKDLSDIMDCSYPTMLKYLNDPGSLKIRDAKRLCSILNLSLTELINK